MKIERKDAETINKGVIGLSPIYKIKHIRNKIINIDGKIYSVDVYVTGGKLEKNSAYLLENPLNNNEFYILPYRGKIENIREAVKPGIYKFKNNTSLDDFIKLGFQDYEEKVKYSIDKIILLDPDSIYNTLTKSNEISSIINEITYFHVNENDNVLMKLLKQAINKKGIDINQYKSRFISNTEFTNAMKPLKGDGGLSLQMFLAWCDKLDIEWKIIIKDKEGCKKPVNDVLAEESFYFKP